MRRALFLLLLLPGVAFAQFSFTFSWVDPTTRTDGSALDPATELQSYRLRCGGPETAEVIVNQSATGDLGNNTRQYVLLLPHVRY